MKAAILSSEGFIFEECEIPVCGLDQVLVKSAGCGICEGDLFQYISKLNDSNNEQEPLILGHEGSGVVVEAGANVSKFKKGDKITALGGNYAEYFVCTAGQLVKVPDCVDVKMALGEPIACCMHAASRFGIEMGDRVALIGAGYMGLTCLQLAKLQGAAEICVFDLIDWRLEMACKLGADMLINNKDKSIKELATLGEFDVVIEATGVQAAIYLGTELLAQHGTLNLVGYHQSNKGMRNIDMKTWNYKALTVVNGHIRDDNKKLKAMERSMNLMAHAKLDTDVLITNYNFIDINQAFKDLKARKRNLYKANLVF